MTREPTAFGRNANGGYRIPRLDVGAFMLAAVDRPTASSGPSASLGDAFLGVTHAFMDF